ncbi:hypothetical protein [Nocardia salmonicida]|uniref:hypothetical protein n=1 Tax=Nocardia salmonicida TaxID=53431 RepID=UPI002E2DA66D|nr:hypothetical protein [Nocardia salmonicida]
MYTSAPRTVLERIIRNSDRSVREWCEVFNDCAGAHREKTSLSERTLRRWMAGDVSGSRAAGSRRIAEQVWKLGFEVLISVPGPTEAEETPESVSDNLDQELTMSTDESARWIRRPGGVEPVVLDQLHADVRKYAADYLHKPPIRLVPKLTQLRREVFDIIDERRPRPRELGELYLIAGQACALLAHACADLGRTHDADTHARTACFAADYAESPPLRAYVAWIQANVAYWGKDYHRAARYAQSGLVEMHDPSTRLRLASQLARAQAATGNHRDALDALDIAMSAIGDVHPQASEPGVMHFEPGKAHYYAAEVHLAIGGRAHAAEALEQADTALTVLSDDCPAEFAAAAHLDAARAHLGLGDAEAANARISTVLELPVELRTTPIVERVIHAGSDLRALAARTTVAGELTERIGLFTMYTARTANTEE